MKYGEMPVNELLSLLKAKYGIIIASIFNAPGGFSTKAAYRVVSADGVEYFLKVYDKALPTTRFFIERVDSYMPVLDWLSSLPSLCGHVLTPIKARNGEYKAETEDNVYVLFLYVRGDVPGVQGMTQAQTVELAEILALLHNAGEAVPFETHGLIEDISLPFCGELAQFLDNMDVKHTTIFEIISPHVELLNAAIRKTLYLRDMIRVGHSPLVLCHGDAHGNNVIQGKRLVLADWEDLRWAPAEADLFIKAWYPHGHALLEAYAAARSNYCINHELVYFYILRRRLEDVWVDIQRLTEENPNEAESVKLLDYLRRGVEEVRVLL